MKVWSEHKFKGIFELSSIENPSMSFLSSHIYELIFF